jgi:outer membrane cobalamin receptor
MFLNRTFFVSVWLILASTTLAQSKLDSTQILNEIAIVGDRYREVIPSQRLSGEKLEALSSFSVADAIRYFSGVQIKDYGGIGGLKTVNIRSMGTNHLGVFYDGIQLGNAQNGQIDLGKFSLDNIEEISLYNGQKSEIFQSAKDFGSAGTIYLRTRRPRFADGKKTNIKSFFRTGSFDLVNPSVLWEQKISKNISSSLNAEYIYSSGKYPFRYRKVLPDKTVAWDTTAIRQNGDIHSLRLEGGLNGYLEQGKWHAKAYFYNSEKGIPGAIVNNEWKHPDRQWDRNFFAQGCFQKIMFKGYDLLLNVKYANDYMRYIYPDTILMRHSNVFTQQEIYASAANKYSILSNWDISFSADYQWNSLDGSLIDGRSLIDANRHTLLAAAATAFEWWRLKAQASVLSTFVRDYADTKIIDLKKYVIANQAHLSAEKDIFTPAFFISYQPFKRHALNFRTFYKRIFRMPTMNDLYYADIGNVSLKPEFAMQYNLGFQYDKNFKRGIVNYLNIRADAYYNEVTDKIVAIPKGNGQYRWMMMNLGYVEIRGVDVSAQIGLFGGGVARNAPAINIGLNYTYQKAQEFTDPTSKWYGGQIAYIPRHNGSAIINTQWLTWDLNYSFIYVGQRYHNSANIPANYEQPWYTHDLTVGKTFLFKKLKTKISAEVNNVLNQYYDVVLNYPMPGRNFKIILKVEI